MRKDCWTSARTKAIPCFTNAQAAQFRKRCDGLSGLRCEENGSTKMRIFHAYGHLGSMRGLRYYCQIRFALFRACSGTPSTATVSTFMRVNASAERVWSAIQFYEEVPGRLPLLLHAAGLRPVRTEGRKTLGAEVLCMYASGYLVKRVTALNPPGEMAFEVVEQDLGIEHGIRAQRGSYYIRQDGNACDVCLSTTYESRLRPRWFWSSIERLSLHSLHRHILTGMAHAIAASPKTTITEPQPQICTPSHSVSRL